MCSINQCPILERYLHMQMKIHNKDKTRMKTQEANRKLLQLRTLRKLLKEIFSIFKKKILFRSSGCLTDKIING